MKRIVKVTYPDGSKKLIVGKQSISEPTPSNNKPVLTREADKDRRPKPGTPAVGLTKQRNGYKRGGKIKFKAS